MTNRTVVNITKRDLKTETIKNRMIGIVLLGVSDCNTVDDQIQGWINGGGGATPQSPISVGKFVLLEI